MRTDQLFTFELTAYISIILVSVRIMRRTLPLKTYKYRIYPNDAQEVFFAKTFGCCRFVWNKMLEEKQQAYKKDDRSPYGLLKKPSRVEAGSSTTKGWAVCDCLRYT